MHTFILKIYYTICPLAWVYLYCIYLLFSYFRNVREEWIKAKYVQKLFLKKLPLADKGANTSPSACKRRWSVSRRTRKSPSRKIPHKISDSSSVEGMKPGLAVEDPKLVTGTDYYFRLN